MFFGEVRVRDAIGSYLAHSVKTPVGRLRKGCRITALQVAHLLEGGHEHITVARLDADDLHEDEAASRVAVALAGNGMRMGDASTGRVNLHALVDGVFDVNREMIDQANAVDEGITIATVQPSTAVGRGRLIATTKIIPYAVSRVSVDRVIACLAGRLHVHELHVKRAYFIQTQLPTLRESVLEKTSRITRQRLLSHHAEWLGEMRVAHEIEALMKALTHGQQTGAHWLLVAGASAIADRQDVIPAAIVRLGGSIDHFGMPVDPGNLLLVGSLGSTRIIGMPGCARSPQPNGLDRVLERLASDLPVDSRWISTLGVGGLLHEIVDRPEPRVVASSGLSVTALVLAAGTSTRFGKTNKLLTQRNSRPVLAHVLEEVQHCQAGSALLITGHDARPVRDLVEQVWQVHGMPARVLHNSLYASGMASSLVRGIAELSTRGADAALICLGDMPDVTRNVMDALIMAFRQNPGKALYIPTYHGRRGNPVIIAASLFDSVLLLEGDVGARVLARAFPDSVMEVACSEPGILLDIDTPADLVSGEPRFFRDDMNTG